MRYKLIISNQDPHFIRIETTVQTRGEQVLRLQLPSWRPGRYELANYAKNVRSFTALCPDGKELGWKKLSKDNWEINCYQLSEFKVVYEYYANQFDAGASYIGNDILYVNPVNCFMYAEGRLQESCELYLDIPDSYQIACQLPAEGKTLKAKNFDQFADSPFMASDKLIHHSFEESNCRIHFWFYGIEQLNFRQLEEDTRKYTRLQAEIFREIPCKDFHFLYPILPYKFRHGVEHCDSTVIAMGPAEDFAHPDFYDDFLAISSHELFHLWNVKRIRPADMLPYDFTRENYSELGYVYEGITTYYGDIILKRTGVWTWEQYAKSLSGDLNKHYQNKGRFNYSLANSSFDTWLDGYVPGVSARKVSIYTEGMIIALIADIMILKATQFKKRLDDVMLAMYESTYKLGRGYRHKDYQHLLEEISGISFKEYFKDLVFGKGQYEKYLLEVLELIGCELLFSTAAEVIIGVEIKKLEAQTPEQERFFKEWAGML
ncbi:MAG: M61 family metallopeptidase [Bacteroidia bacterium]